MPYEIGKVFSDSVMAMLQRQREQGAQPGTRIGRAPRSMGRGTGGMSPTVEAARIRADTAKADREAKAAAAGKPKEMTDYQKKSLELREAAHAFRERAADAKTEDEGVKIVADIIDKMHKTDIFGREGEARLREFAALLQDVRVRLIGSPQAGGLGLPRAKIDVAVSAGINEMASMLPGVAASSPMDGQEQGQPAPSIGAATPPTAAARAPAGRVGVDRPDLPPVLSGAQRGGPYPSFQNEKNPPLAGVFPDAMAPIQSDADRVDMLTQQERDALARENQMRGLPSAAAPTPTARIGARPATAADAARQVEAQKADERVKELLRQAEEAPASPHGR